MPPDESRSEGTPSLSEVPNAGAQRFGYFGAFAKVTRRKGETASGSTRSNGYSQRTPKAWSAQRPPRRQKKGQPKLPKMPCVLIKPGRIKASCACSHPSR
ncbi:hypothetical protein C1X59_11210 [Pseudomonas sp. FW215-R2]|nr:hypothetical protein C1X59_11210 [Pseudomonas sp. FW215-R2]PMX07836.1 hypothetical protein C1X60_19545 [Pseudomonas sp. FW215-L1]PMX21757.1 hypothetical protein C1X57_17120 [Pseudomonas sp. FW215-E1]PNA26712.1 hypothetical protein C1X58_20420 [Pseudomonas sp. FW215-R4]